MKNKRCDHTHCMLSMVEVFFLYLFVRASHKKKIFGLFSIFDLQCSSAILIEPYHVAFSISYTEKHNSNLIKYKETPKTRWFPIPNRLH